MPLVTRQASNHTIMRTVKWRALDNRLLIMRISEPRDGADPYEVGFDQHDASNYETSEWRLKLFLPRVTLGLEFRTKT